MQAFRRLGYLSSESASYFAKLDGQIEGKCYILEELRPLGSKHPARIRRYTDGLCFRKSMENKRLATAWRINPNKSKQRDRRRH